MPLKTLENKVTYKTEILEIVIKKKMYRDPDFSAQKLGEMIGVPNYKVSKILKKEFGMSFSDIVLRKRIEEAKKKLVNEKYKDMMVDDIGVMVGFKNRQSFFDAFHKYASTTPDKWRKANNNNQ